jgi:hypothetical protein
LVFVGEKLFDCEKNVPWFLFIRDCGEEFAQSVKFIRGFNWHRILIFCSRYSNPHFYRGSSAVFTVDFLLQTRHQ